MRMKLTGAAALLALAACGQDQAPQVAEESPQQLVSGIDLNYIDTSIRPGDDFFGHVNGKWLAEFEIPADKSNYGSFTKLHEESQEDVKAIIEMSASGDFAKGTDEQKVGDLYNSYLDMDTRNARGVEPLQAELDRIAAISSHDELARYFASALTRGFGAGAVKG